MKDSEIEHGAQLAERGYVVFPALRTRERGPGCKVPPGGFLWRDAGARSAEEARRLAARYPAADGWAVDCGASGLVVVDLDPGHDPELWRAFEARDATPRGEHVLLAEARYAAVGNGDYRRHGMTGVDVKGLGGYVIAYGPFPPRETLPACPGWLVEKMRAARGLENVDLDAAGAPATGAGGAGRADPFSGPARLFTKAEAGRYVAAALDRLTSATPGSRNNTLNEVAMTIGHFVPAFWAEDLVTEQLATRAAGIGLAYGEARATIRSGLAAGMREPYDRIDVAADDTEDHTEVDAGESEARDDAVSRLLGEMLSFEQLATMPAPVSLIEGLLNLNSLAWLIGKAGSYKSFVALDWAGHVSQGKAWQGRRVRQGKVWISIGEGLDGTTLRVRAWMNAKGPADQVKILPRPVQANSAEWSTYIAAAQRDQPDLIIIDTQARHSVGIEENSNTDMGKFVQQLERLREASGACVLIVHHIGRSGDDARGASAIDGAQGSELKVEKIRALRASVSVDKQKDMAEEEAIEIDLKSVQLGINQDTGKPITSLVIVDDSFASAKPAIPYDTDFIDNLPFNQSDVMRVIVDLFAANGGTKAEIKRAINERRAQAKKPTMRDSSYYKAFDTLIAENLLARVSGTQRYTFNPETAAAGTRFEQQTDSSEMSVETAGGEDQLEKVENGGSSTDISGASTLDQGP